MESLGGRGFLGLENKIWLMSSWHKIIKNQESKQKKKIIQHFLDHKS